MGLFDVNLVVLNLDLELKDRTRRQSGNALFRKQGSLFLHGASGTGKTTMLEKSTGKSYEELKTISRTIGAELHLANEGEGTFMITDVGGDPVFENERHRMLNEVKPLAIVILLDHAPRTMENEEAYRCPPNGNLPKDKSHPIRVRHEEHIRTIQELREVFYVSPAVAERCRLVVPLINKRDAWENLGYSLPIFTDWYFNALTELNNTLINNKIKWRKPIGVSGKHEGFGASWKLIEKLSGKELYVNISTILNLTLRVPLTNKST
jgi:hypothetical protein